MSRKKHRYKVGNLYLDPIVLVFPMDSYYRPNHTQRHRTGDGVKQLLHSIYPHLCTLSELLHSYRPLAHGTWFSLA